MFDAIVFFYVFFYFGFGSTSEKVQKTPNWWPNSKRFEIISSKIENCFIFSLTFAAFLFFSFPFVFFFLQFKWQNHLRLTLKMKAFSLLLNKCSANALHVELVFQILLVISHKWCTFYGCRKNVFWLRASGFAIFVGD